MKKLYLFIVLLINSFIFSQERNIKKEMLLPRDIDYKGCVKKITIKTLRIERMTSKTDSVRTVSEVYFFKNGKVQSLNLYDKASKDSWRKVEFDALERITAISRNNGLLKFDFINQYYSGNSEYPDSTKIFSDENYKEKYINRFFKNLVMKQERYVNDTLKDFRVYRYNNQNQLIEDLYHNTENEKGETLVTSESNKGYKMSFYPEKQTLYEYKKDKDTTIVTKISPRYSLKEVTKMLKNNQFELNIIEKYDKDFLERSEATWTSKDSMSYYVYFYGPKKKIRDYYKTFKNSEKIVYKSKSDFYNETEEKVVTTTIETVFDKYKNWIKKTYFREGRVESSIEREIEYCSK
ncbi:hypothetical protein [Flavobacterium panacagri]|uniref:hypothetical protein n=1 Tax=Flavobacterium panacagri TaxID=3034146 RepID=UPI0025A66D27|nr:hypothetical protein [Flavobacterium panacagri]